MKSTLPKLLIFTFWGALVIQGMAQAPSRPYRKLITYRMQQKLEKQLPNILRKRAKIERFTDSVRQVPPVDSMTIPLVFHIFYASPEQQVSERQVMSQIEALNRDFGKENYEIRHKADTLEGFYQRVADIKIKFCLGGFQIGGNPVSPIHYISTSDSLWGTENRIKNSLLGGVSPWNPEHQVNIWVAPLKNGISGYAQMPGGPWESDGIVIDYRFFGINGTSIPPYNEGKTLTHLMGNYLNLKDLWSPGNDCSDDGVRDTPIHNGPNYTCPTYKHVSLCPGNPVEMTMNFMDNTDDACMYMFTEGQRARMNAVLLPGGARDGLVFGRTQCNPFFQSRLSDPNAPTEGTTWSSNVFLYPNPTSDKVHLMMKAEESGWVELEVYSALGNVIHTKKIFTNSGEREYILDCKDWASGIYYIQVVIDDSSSSHQLVVR